jgi:hypothetical protein
MGCCTSAERPTGSVDRIPFRPEQLTRRRHIFEKITPAQRELLELKFKKHASVSGYLNISQFAKIFPDLPQVYINHVFNDIFCQRAKLDWIDY